MITLISAVTIALSPLLEDAGETVVESRKSLPLAYDVDIVVAGGSLAGVEAACAAADAGASVLVVESRPYLGYDICANQKLWLNPDEKPETRPHEAIFPELLAVLRACTFRGKAKVDRSLS